MTRKEVVDFLEKCRWWFEPFTSEKEQWNEALDIAIEALTQESTQDLISRQDAITIPVMPKEHRQYQTMNIDDAYERGWYDLQDCIESLPSAEPQPKPISYIDCANAMLKMWIDNILTDGEYYRIMDKLNSKHMADMRGE